MLIPFTVTRAPVGRERFGIHFVATGPVQCVADVGPQFLQIQVIGTAADLFVAGEAESYIAMLEFRFPSHQFGRGGHNCSDARFVVCAQQRRSVGSDDRLADALFEVRILVDANDLGRIPRQFQVRAVVVLVDDRFHLLRRIFGRGIHVGDEGDDRYRGLNRAGHRGHDDAVLIATDVGQTQGSAFVGQQAAENQLFRRAGSRGTGFIRLSINSHVAEKAIEQ